MNTTKRRRTFEWEDPRLFLDAMPGISGLEFLQRFANKEMPRPPIGALMDFTLAEVTLGRAVFTAEPAEFHYNPIGVVHGGLAATLLDSAMGCAVHSMLPPGVGYTTLEIKVNFVRALTAATGTVRSEGTVVHMGSRTATAEGRIVDGAGKLYAHATTTCLVLAPSVGAGAPAGPAGEGARRHTDTQ
jgi:uncharacterized protein (TIGR00369 family)